MAMQSLYIVPRSSILIEYVKCSAASAGSGNHLPGPEPSPDRLHREVTFSPSRMMASRFPEEFTVTIANVLKPFV